MAKKFNDVGEWIADCRTTVRRDLDNLILFTGPEGQGKSTVAFQVMRALDDAFDSTRAHFGIASFLAHAPRTPRYGAVLADELEANKRRGMTTLTLDLLDFLKDCRGLNLHMGICFPHEDLFEGAILNFRVRWKVHVPQRGLFILYERVERKYRNKSREEVTVYQWVERGRWRFTKNAGALWAAYGEKKQEHMKNLGGRYRELLEAPTGVDRDRAVSMFQDAATRGEWVDPDTIEKPAPPPKVYPSRSSGIDHGHVVAHFSRLRRQHEERAGPGAAIKDLP